MKRLIAVLAAAILIVVSSFNAFAAWVPDAVGLKWQNEDGSFAVYGWKWIDENGDGVSERYCFDPSGYVFRDTITPDGCTVNHYGAWYKDGVVKINYDNTGIMPVWPGNNTWIPPQNAGWQQGTLPPPPRR